MTIKARFIFAASLTLAASSMSYANDETRLEEVRVTASGQSLNDVAQPVQVFSEDDMQIANGNTIGDLLSNLPGISNASFGAGVGRPVIRGLGGNRVKMAINGTDTADVSAMSSDHAPMVDAANANQLEVIYGPSTLRFGSGAMGGVVNMADSRFHETQLLGLQGQIKGALSTANEGTDVSTSLDVGNGPWVVHVDGFARQTENYRAGNGNDVANTATDSQGINLGVSHIRDNGNSMGLAVSALDYEYGVPNPDNDPASVSPTQTRFDAQSIFYGVSPLLDQVKLQLTHIDYEHGENFDDTIVGLFDKQSTEFKTTFELSPYASWQSVVGVQLSLQELDVCHDHGGCSGIPNYSELNWDGTQGDNLVSAGGWLFAHDTPMPLTQTQDVGLFWIAETHWAYGLLELGARVDRRQIELDPVSMLPSYRKNASYYADKDFESASFSAAMTWQLTDQKVGLSVSRSQRAPAADEMYWNGDHHATFSFQLDNPELDVETAHSIDLTWQYAGKDFAVSSAVYYYDFDGYIYNDLKGLINPIHPEDPVYRNEQRDAWFAGTEWQLDYDVADHWQWFVAGDYVRAQLKQGANKNLPRTPPLTIASGVAWNSEQWLVRAEVKHFAKQTDVAENESTTDGYSLLNVYGAYHHAFNQSELQLYVRAHNLTDELGRNHVSYLKDYSFIVGRNITLGVNYSF